MTNFQTDIREYKSITEIESIDGFIPNEPFEKSEYESIIGDYHLTHTVKCCLLKVNSACAKEHNYGFVIRLKNGRATIIGNSCANANFDAATTLQKDMRTFNAAKIRKQKLELIRSSTLAEGEFYKILETADLALRKIQITVSTISRDIGSETARKLREMASTQNNAVQISLSKTKISLNKETKKEEKETTKFNATIGHISGYQIFNPSYWSTLQTSMKKLQESLIAAKAIVENPESFSNAKISSISLKLNEKANLEQLNHKLSEELQAFESNNHLLLSYLTESKSEKINSAQYHLKQEGKLSGKNQAKHLLETFEAEIKAKYNADRITPMSSIYGKSKAFG
ncbi:hypothetical protein [Pseudomonas subflava]|uniref:hypothetical protein n=1 Tax=Pseudomonas subflava TaxID=2952933 RepID=UPI00207AFDE3|nr:hypothetical protein [Pseudomonas subflava]